ncbi:hypothetical protein L5515_014694 [Caenorhabditis briggsae]|uniref:Ionotropic glutamate receptor L-glutamate and glycine-binding domain-containing protein n=1 Tax=Caenorhabditis briggsae TaxID=6238 RepID=A0AAE9E9V3_CAEBR|nr:hypothetical protein L5515_014694 [Caenorhabditis briggsae]
MAGVRPHLKIGVDSSLNNKGSTFKIGYQVGLEIEQCEMLMKALQWTYEFVQYNNQIGHVLENGTATGMLGDIQKGRIDMACGRFRMTADRARILTFTYPTQLEVNQVYLITNPQKSEDVGFLFRPFSTVVWFLLSITILIVSATFFVLRAVEFKSKEGLTAGIQNSISQVLLSTFNLEIRVKNKSTFFAFHLFSAIWLLAWFHVFVDLYTSELSGMMVVSDKKHMPFEDFYGMVENLRKGIYRLFTPSSDRLPECPREIPPSKCIAMFSEILSRHPPEYGDVTRLNELDFVSSVCPAAYIVRPTFPYLDELNEMIIKVLPAFSAIDNHYTPAYPELSLFDVPSKSSFTLNQLSSIFVIHMLGTLIASLLLIAEILIGKV